jgi:nucleotide-binding universal stress UspA family protein
MLRRILVGLDGSQAAQHALTRALELARLARATVHLLSVPERLRAYVGTAEEIEQEAEYHAAHFTQLQERARDQAQAMGVQVEAEIAPGQAAELLVCRAREGRFDLLVVGHTEHSRLHHLLLGSTAQRVVKHAHCPVLVVR